MLRADLHIHTEYSMDCDMSLEQVIERCLKKKINCVAIADHGTIEGALRMQSLAPFKVIVAEEILTPHGEIMGMFLQQTVPSGQSIARVLDAIHAQGGLVCIPHPYDTLRPSALGGKILAEIVEHVDLVEAFNSRDVLKRHSAQTEEFARQHDIPTTAGSDAHSLQEIGNACVEMPEFETREEFLKSLRQGRITGRRSNPLHRFNGLTKRLRNRFK